MGSSRWKLMTDVREQFCTHWPKGIVRRQEGDMVTWHCPRCLQDCAEGSKFFPLPFSVPFFPVVNFKGKLERLIGEKIPLSGSLLNTVLTVYRV